MTQLLSHMNDSWQVESWHDSFIYDLMTYSYVWHDSFICVAWLIHTRDMTYSHVKWPTLVWHGSSRVTWLIRICGMTRLYAWHDVFTCEMTHSSVKWIITCDMTHSNVWQNLFTCEMTDSCVTWFITCDMTRLSVWHDSFITYSHVKWPTHVWHDSSRVTWLVYLCDMTHSYMTHSHLQHD